MSQLTYNRTYRQRSGANVGPSRFCCWVEGERPYGPDPFCGAPSVDGTSYCAEHKQRCYRSTPAPTGGVFKFGSAA